MNQEKVLCFKRSLLTEIGHFQGICLDAEKYLLPILTSSLTYRRRDTVETDPTYKQIIPYVLVVSGDKILRYLRSKTGGEGRLHGLYSVGIGGHISNEDHLGYFDGMRRELKEEIGLNVDTAPPVAVINDETTEVGSVHFGVVHVVQVTDETLARCPDIESPEFVNMDEATKDLGQYESWSAFCLANLEALVAKACE